MTVFFSPEEERAILEHSQQQRALAASAATEWDDAKLDELEEMSNRYPWLDAGSIEAMASGGLRATDPEVSQIAGAAAAEQTALGLHSDRALSVEEARVIASFLNASDRLAGGLSRQASNATLALEQGQSRERNLSAAVDRFGQTPLGTTDDEFERATGEARPDNRNLWQKGWDSVSSTHGRGVGLLYEGTTVYEQGVKPATRGASVVLDALPQAFQGSAAALNDRVVNEGFAAGFYGWLIEDSAKEGFRQTDLFALGADAVGDIGRGELPRVDAGTGLFVDPESEVGQSRLARRLEFETVDDAPFSIGRWSAGGITEPGTRSHGIMSGLVDLGLEVVGPGAVVTDGILLQARNGRRTIDATRSVDFLDANPEIVQRLADSKSFTYVDDALGTQADPRVVSQIVASDDIDDVRRLIDSQLGIEVTDTPSLPRFRPEAELMQDHLPSIQRLAGTVPENMLSISNPRQRVNNTRSWLRSANASSDDIDRFSGMMAGAQTNDELLQATRTMLEETALRYLDEDLTLAGTDAATDLISNNQAARSIGRMWSREIEEARAYWGRVITDPEGGTSIAHVDLFSPGGTTTSPRPQDYVEFLSSNIPLPSAQELRQTFASPLWRAATKTRGQRATINMLDSIASSTTEHWKVMRLLRVGWPVKVIGEEQLRLAFSGFSSSFTHPLQHLLYAASESGLVSRVGLKPRGATGALGTPVADMDIFKRAMFSGGDMARVGSSKRMVLAKGYDLYGKFDVPRDFAVAQWSEQAARLSESPVIRMALNSESFDEAAEFFWDNMSEVRKVIQDEDAIDVLDIVRNRADADTYLRDAIFGRIDEFTNGSPELREAMKSRSLDGNSMRPSSSPTSISRKFEKAVDARFDALPDVIQGRRVVELEHVKRLDTIYDRIFEFIMSRPANKMSRIPLWRQSNWQAIEDLALSLDPKAAGRLLRNARKANLSEGQIRRIAERARKAGPKDRMLTLEELEALAGARATNQVKRTLYDLSERRNFFEITKNFFPFGDAFFEVLTRWGTILAENPNRANKGRHLIQDVLSSAQDQEGFFQENQFGQETFAYPAAGSLLSLLGVSGNPELRAPLAGVTMVSEFYPGFGPVPQLGASAVLPDDPDSQWMRDILSSGYGLPPNVFEDFSGAAVDTLFPPWAVRLATGAFGNGWTEDDDRIFANTTTQIMMHKIANDPNWSLDRLDSEDAIADLVATSRQEARTLYGVRAGVQMLAPTSPGVEFYTDLDGERMASWLVDEAYRSFVTIYGPQEAVGQFIDAFGVDAVGLTRPLSIDITSGGGMPVYQTGIDWVKDNEFAQDAYPSVYGFFAPPQTDPNDFVYDEYVARFRSGESEALSPEEAVNLFQDYIGGIRYSAERERVLALNGDTNTREVQEYMRAFRTQLLEELPGYNPDGLPPGVPGRVDVDKQIAQLTEAVADERLAGEALTDPLKEYLGRRDEIMALSDGPFTSGSNDAYLRAHMYEVGTILARENREFAEVWDRVLYREFRDQHENDLEEGDG